MATVWKLKLPSGLDPMASATMSMAAESDASSNSTRKSDAEAWLVETSHDVVRGLHTPAVSRPP